DDSAGLLVYAREQKKGEQPVPKIVCREGRVESVICPRLLAEVLEASVQDEGADWRDFTCRNASLYNGFKTETRSSITGREHNRLTLIPSATWRILSSF